MSIRLPISGVPRAAERQEICLLIGSFSLANQNYCISAELMKISGAADTAQLRLIIGIFQRQFPNAITEKETLPNGALTPASRTTRHVI
jgi:hypothetical protein